MTLYVRSSNGTGGSGSSWATAKVTLQEAGAADVAGDTIYVSQAHSESSAATIFFGWAGLINLPVSVICALDSSEPPVSATTGAVVNVTGANSEIQCDGSVYCYGVNFRNNGTATCSIWLHNNHNNSQLWESCNFEVNSDQGGHLYLNAVNTTTGDITWRNVGVKFAGTAACTIVTQNDKFRWEGGSFLAGSMTPQPGIFEMSGTRYSDITVTGVDFSGLDTSLYMLSQQGGGRLIMRNCKLPNGWTGGFFSGALTFSFRGEMYNCAYGATNVRLLIKEHMGKIQDESTIVKAAGANDGVNSFSHKFSANGNCNAAYSRLRGPEIAMWNDLTSATMTLNLDIIHDNLTGLTNRDVGVEVVYLGASASPLGSVTSSLPTDPIGSATALVSSSATWVTTGLTNPNKQKISVSFTPMQRGYVQARIVQTIGSYTLYVDPKLTIV